MPILNRFPGIYCVNANDQNELLNRLADLDVRCFELDGSLISDTESFYAEASKALPLDPPLLDTPKNWDAFEDSLWGGLDDLAHPQVAVIWKDADQFANASLPQLIEICIVVNDVIKSVALESTGITVPVNLIMILMGTGDSFVGFDEMWG